MDHNFKPKIEIPIFITYFHKRKKQDRHHSVSKLQNMSHYIKNSSFQNIIVRAKNGQNCNRKLGYLAQKFKCSINETFYMDFEPGWTSEF